MARILHSSHSFFFRKCGQVLLACFWLLGLGSGILIFRDNSHPLVSMMQLAPQCRLSIVGLMAVTLLPFLFSAFAVYISRRELLLPVCFLKACSFAYISSGVFAAYEDAGWLIHILLMFSDSLGVYVLYLFWMRHISGFRRLRLWGCMLYAGGLGLICAADRWVVAPFLRELLF